MLSTGIEHCSDPDLSSLHERISIVRLIVPTVPAQCYTRGLCRRINHSIITRQAVADVRSAIGGIPPQFMQQQHRANCIEITKHRMIMPAADASITAAPKLALSVYTADCVPILLASSDGCQIAAIHAGWRGLFHGVIFNTLQSCQQPASNYSAWLGPAISQRAYLVNEQFRVNFCDRYPHAENHFLRDGSYVYFDCPGFAESQLRQCGVQQIHQNRQCTFLNNQLPSYRRSEGRSMARILSLIWRH